MSRSQDRKCYYTRWSDPVLRRRYSMHLVPTSEEDTSSVRRSRSSSPLLNTLHASVAQLDPQIACLSCRNHYKKQKSSKSQFSKSSGTRDGSQRMRESLEIQLVGSQVEEALSSDKQTALLGHLELATDALEALMQHISSLQVSHVSAQRAFHLVHRLILPQSSPMINCRNSVSADLKTRLRQAESCKDNNLRLLCDAMENCSKNIGVSKQLQSLIDDHKMKKKDFAVAARNFKNLLDNSKLTLSQMDKLQWQYQAIMDDYKQNRRILESQLPSIIKIRLGAIVQGFSTIAAFYEDTEYFKQVSELLKILGETLCQDESATDNHHKYAKSQVQEMCQKCKVNRVEKK
ncbi:uncharacterized protein LOC107223712 [Neodiprion lecontei]|uniref:Uncharacterized protein LOC107223712 n=1 Tax=Neodiprion lecontei TaxID=441921 RepID=A0A6J0BXJ9_NEOLC|nr:uncharacterized protein LOC107223712 [Neodiprion lecontei]